MKWIVGDKLRKGGNGASTIKMTTDIITRDHKDSETPRSGCANGEIAKAAKRPMSMCHVI